MPDHEIGNRGANRGALFGGVFARGGTDTSDAAWLGTSTLPRSASSRR